MASPWAALLWATAVVADGGGAGQPACDAPFSDVADASVAAWVAASEANVSSGSWHVVLGGDSSAHYEAAVCALRAGAVAAGAPPMAFESVFAPACWAEDCAEAAFRGVADYVLSRRGRYGVVFLGGASRVAPWVLKTLATYFFGARTCGHAVLDAPGWPADCGRIAWVLSRAARG